MKPLLLLFRIRMVMLWHSIERFNVEKAIKLVVFLTLGIAFILIDFLFFWRIISQVVNMVELGNFRFSFIIRLLNMVFVLFLGMVLFSNIGTALSTFFLSKDLALLNSSPFKLFDIFVHKFLETFVNSSWMVLIFGFPIFVAYGIVFEAEISFYFVILLIIVPFLLIPSALGVSVTMLLMRFFPAERTRQVIASLGIFIGAGIVVMIRLLRPEEFIKPISAARVEYYDTLLRIPMSPYLPSTWVTESMMGIINGNMVVFRENILLLWAVSLAFVYFTYLLARSIYRQAYSRSQEGGAPNPGRAVKHRFHFLDRLFRFMKPQTSGFFIKDIKVFFREPTQWSQLFLLGAIIFVYLFNVRSVPYFSWFMSNFAGFLNVGMAGFVMAALGARFVYPSVSLEGGSFWIVHSAPVNYSRFIMQKFLLYFVPLVLLSEILIVVSNYFLKVDDYLKLLSMVLIFIVTLTNVGLGLGLGCLYPRFRVENPAQIALGIGGIIYMLISLMYLIVVIALQAWPIKLHFEGLLYGSSIGFREVLPYHLITLLLSLILTGVPLFLGIRSLKRMELD